MNFFVVETEHDSSVRYDQRNVEMFRDHDSAVKKVADILSGQLNDVDYDGTEHNVGFIGAYYVNLDSEKVTKLKPVIERGKFKLEEEE